MKKVLKISTALLMVLSIFIIYFSAIAATVVSYELVTDINELSIGDTIIITDSDNTKALSTIQNKNNRGTVAIELIDGIIQYNSEIQEITLESGLIADTFALNAGNGYLYAASSSSNYLRTESTLSNNSSWKITISNNIATIISQGDYTRNNLKYNKSSNIFSCYSSGQNDISIYKKIVIDDSNQIEINFYVDSELYRTVYTELGGSVVFPENPSKLGYNFLGWFDDPINGNKYEELIANESMTLYAHFEKSKYSYVEIKEIDKLTSGSGYATYNGTHTTSNNEFDYVSYQVMMESNLIQIQKNTGYIYNTTLFGKIKSISFEFKSGSLLVSSSPSPMQSSAANTQEINSNNNVYLPENESDCYFYIKNSDETTKLNSIVIEYESIELDDNLLMTTQTQSSLKIAYDIDLKPTDVDFRIGGIIPNELYYDGAVYGVIATNREFSFNVGKTDYQSIDEYIANNAGYNLQNIVCKPVAVENGYQFAWVITNMEGHYLDIFNATIYIEVGNSLYLCSPFNGSVITTGQKYLDKALELGLTEEQQNVISNLVNN